MIQTNNLTYKCAKNKMWSQQQISLIISMYRDNKCLYVTKHPLYKNRNARNEALSKIQSELLKLGQRVSIQDIKCKWNNLRTNFMAQYRKYIVTVKTGTGDEEQELDRPTLWYFDQMQFIVEHCTPRESQDSLSEITMAETAEHDYQETEESVRDGELEEMNLGEGTSSTSVYQLSEDENEDSQELNPAKKHGIHNTQVVKKPDLQNYALCRAPAAVVPSNATPTTNYTNKRRKRKANSEDDFMNTATTALSNLTNVFTMEQQTALPGASKKSDIPTFVDFVGSQLEYLTSNKDLLLETQQEITNIIWAARRKVSQN